MKSVFKEPLCLDCYWFKKTIFQDGTMIQRCGYMDVVLRHLAIECSDYDHKNRRLQKWMSEINNAESARKLIIINPEKPQTGPGDGYA